MKTLMALMTQLEVQVTMVELDEAVMRAVREHMPSVAGGALDCYKGERSKVSGRKTFSKGVPLSHLVYSSQFGGGDALV